MSASIAIRTLLAALMLCPLAAHASPLSRETAHAPCIGTSCAQPDHDAKDADYVFGKSKHERETGDRSRHDRDRRTGHGNDKDYGPIEIPPRGKPGLIHTGAGKDIVPAPSGIGPVVPAPTAVPAPAAIWLLVSGLAGLALGAGRRRRT